MSNFNISNLQQERRSFSIQSISVELKNPNFENTRRNHKKGHKIKGLVHLLLPRITRNSNPKPVIAKNRNQIRAWPYWN